MKYTCVGSVRGRCGINHRSVGTAVKCTRSDGDGCAKQGGYSDRTVMSIDEEGHLSRLTVEEYSDMIEAEHRLD